MWKTYRRRGYTQIRPWTPDDKVMVTEIQQQQGSPKQGDMLCRDVENHEDTWLITETFFKNNYELVHE